MARALGPQQAHLAGLDQGDIRALVDCCPRLGLFCGLPGADLVGGAAGKLFEAAIRTGEAPLAGKHGLDAGWSAWIGKFFGDPQKKVDNRVSGALNTLYNIQKQGEQVDEGERIDGKDSSRCFNYRDGGCRPASRFERF